MSALIKKTLKNDAKGLMLINVLRKKKYLITYATWVMKRQVMLLFEDSYYYYRSFIA